MGYRNVLDLAIVRQDGERVVLSGAGLTLTGVRKQPLPGPTARLAIRPEEIAVGEGSGGANTITGRVDNVEYCGRDSLLDIVIEGGAMLHVRALPGVRSGDTIRVTVPPERALVYADV
jgi:ABC-type sugar transport system ATPase subunit